MTKTDNSKEFEELREKVRSIIIDPNRLEFGETKVNLRVGGTVDRIMNEVHRASQELVRDTLERLMKTEGEAVTYKIDGSHGWAVPIGRLDAELAQLKQEGEKHE